MSVFAKTKNAIIPLLSGVGDMCVASVESKEDYGYTMDLGSSAFTGFLSQESADS